MKSGKLFKRKINTFESSHFFFIDFTCFTLCEWKVRFSEWNYRNLLHTFSDDCKNLKWLSRFINSTYIFFTFNNSSKLRKPFPWIMFAFTSKLTAFLYFKNSSVILLFEVLIETHLTYLKVKHFLVDNKASCWAIICFTSCTIYAVCNKGFYCMHTMYSAIGTNPLISIVIAFLYAALNYLWIWTEEKTAFIAAFMQAVSPSLDEIIENRLPTTGIKWSFPFHILKTSFLLGQKKHLHRWDRYCHRTHNFKFMNSCRGGCLLLNATRGRDVFLLFLSAWT